MWPDLSCAKGTLCRDLQMCAGRASALGGISAEVSVSCPKFEEVWGAKDGHIYMKINEIECRVLVSWMQRPVAGWNGCSKSLGPIYQTTRRHTPEDINIIITANTPVLCRKLLKFTFNPDDRHNNYPPSPPIRWNQTPKLNDNTSQKTLIFM